MASGHNRAKISLCFLQQERQVFCCTLPRRFTETWEELGGRFVVVYPKRKTEEIKTYFLLSGKSRKKIAITVNLRSS
jgi:hypothetical protein